MELNSSNRITTLVSSKFLNILAAKVTRVVAMSTLKKNKRAKLAKKHALYGENKPAIGNSVSQRGKAKYLGGNGRKTTGITKRYYYPNLQSIRIQTPEGAARKKVCVNCIRSNRIQKAVVREPFTIPGQG